MNGLTLRVIIGALFSAIGLVTLFITKQTLTAAIWLSFGNGLILSDLRFTTTDENGHTFIKPIPKARTITAIGLLIFAVILLLFQVYIDYSQSTPTE